MVSDVSSSPVSGLVLSFVMLASFVCHAVYSAASAGVSDRFDPLLQQEVGTKENMVDEFGELHASGIHIVGRIVLNLWRQMQATARLDQHAPPCDRL